MIKADELNKNFEKEKLSEKNTKKFFKYLKGLERKMNHDSKKYSGSIYYLPCDMRIYYHKEILLKLRGCGHEAYIDRDNRLNVDWR